MIEIHLYGGLRRYGPPVKPGRSCVLTVEAGRGETVSSLLAGAGIPKDEVNHIFMNSKLLASRARVAVLYGYLQTRHEVHDWELDVPVGDEARLGLFGRDMAMLSM
jgi:hypothetical protein